MKQPLKLPPNLRGKFVSRAAFAKMQAEKQRLEKDIYTMTMGTKNNARQVWGNYKRKFMKDKWISDGLREIAKQELPRLMEKYGKTIIKPEE